MTKRTRPTYTLEFKLEAAQPADWLRLEGTKEIIDEFFNSEDSRCPLIVAKQGRYGGTCVHELLAVSYALLSIIILTEYQTLNNIRAVEFHATGKNSTETKTNTLP
ncbi:hypothetical protein A9R01_00880 ['Osedax' symbiont bacterium Rs2_46_30_T18]|nr:hypothetical protein A9R01_00880 ['Osedax' symbiont bacterium Rs2_46_30_T18]